MLSKVTTENSDNSILLPVRFQVGRIYVTPGAIDAPEDAGESAQEFINRHARLEQG
jgi:hypothetical protein